MGFVPDDQAKVSATLITPFLSAFPFHFSSRLLDVWDNNTRSTVCHRNVFSDLLISPPSKLFLTDTSVRPMTSLFHRGRTSTHASLFQAKYILPDSCFKSYVAEDVRVSPNEIDPLTYHTKEAQPPPFIIVGHRSFAVLSVKPSFLCRQISIRSGLPPTPTQSMLPPTPTPPKSHVYMLAIRVRCWTCGENTPSVTVVRCGDGEHVSCIYIYIYIYIYM